MAIAARTNPELIVNGTIKAVRDITKKDTGEALGSSLRVETAGGDLYVTAWDRSGFVANVGDRIAAVVSVEESARGAQITLDHVLTPGDLDRLASDTNSLVSK